MVSLTDMKQAARVVNDENGNPVVQVPLDVWEAVVGKVEEKQPELSQGESIKALLKSWENEPDDKSPEWWGEFDEFLKENPVQLGDPDSFPGDE
jgi:hypothetical protein